MDRLQEVAEELQTELREAQKQLREAQTNVERIQDLLERLQAKMPETEKVWLKQRNAGDPNSIRVMMEKILDASPTGMKVKEIGIELEKAGLHSRAKNPVRSAETVLYRNRPIVFLRGKDARWTLAKTPEKLESRLQLVRKSDDAS